MFTFDMVAGWRPSNQYSMKQSKAKTQKLTASKPIVLIITFPL